MIENRLELNTKNKYTLHDGTLVKRYDYNVKASSVIPEFEPDICITAWGTPLGEVLPKGKKTCQIWIKTDNEELIAFIKNIDWLSKTPSVASPKIESWRVRKIILEEFYGIKGE